MQATLLLLLFTAAAASAQDAAQLFTRVIEPVFRKDCQGCHGDGQTMAKLDLRTRDAVLKGGQRGPAMVAGQSESSLLVRVLRGEGVPQMPPVGAKPDAAFVEAVAKWIDGGAPWPAAASSGDRWGTYKEADLWAFRPLQKARLGSVDAYLDRALAAKGLKAAPKADKRTLLRRVTFDLTGLPPTPEETDAFLKDTTPQAYARAVDRLLASPRYGERWARHWLDVVRYADSSGYSNDFERPNAWRYRDYVIRAFQNDKPYDRFLREQIAGDELFPGDAEALIATGFLRAGPWEHTAMSVEAVTRQLFLDDVTSAVGSTFLGLTVGCARCHDHKFDPIPTKDYYRLQAVFAATEFARPKLPFLPAENPGDAESRQILDQIVRRTQANMDRFGEMGVRNAMKKHGVTRVEDLPPGVAEKARRTNEGVTPQQFEEYKVYQKHMGIYRDSVDRFEPKVFAVSNGPLDGATDGGPALRYPKRAEYKPAAVHVLPGGNVQSPAERVSPGVLSLVARYAGLEEPAIPEAVEGRRAALANWVADARNPLTARVMVNRIWQYHFGRGLVADANNFGKMGRKPSHPELLDFLAAKFIESGWSVKAMHRMMLLSEGYQRASSHPAMDAVRTADPANDLLAYMMPRRLEAEAVRDSILAVSGELSDERGGPGVFPQINEDVARQAQHRMGSLAPAYQASPTRRERNRRTIYTFQQRTQPDPMMEVFNGATMDLSCERREASVLPTQAFTLFNGEFVNDMALAWANRLAGAGKPEQWVRSAFLQAFGRVPDAVEQRLALAHYQRLLAAYQGRPAAPRPAAKPIVHQLTSELTGESFAFEQFASPAKYEHNLHASEVTAEVRALAGVTLGLLNSNEFLYVY
ncbi:MAG: PSD1 domain-containing protein [Bryobacterales bacterium]|nr:PSD1 domain-containing protein [Bryobacterales bacterium]